MVFKKYAGLTLLFWFLGLTFHFWPNLGIPMHSDVIWFFRLQTTNNSELAFHIPEGVRGLGAYPKGLFSACLDWYQLTARVNCADIAGLRTSAVIAGKSADLWRLIYILILSTAVFFFYQILRLIAVPKAAAILLTLGLFFSPLGMWTDYKSAEPRAILFLMIAYYLVLRSMRVSVQIFSAFLVLLAVLTKETFAVGWLFVPALVFIKGRLSLKKFLRLMVHHVTFAIIFSACFLAIRHFWSSNSGGYVFEEGYGVDYPILKYLVYNTFNLLPTILLVNKYIFLASIAVFLVFLPKIVKYYFNLRTFVIISSLILAILAHETIYYLTGRWLFDRYLLPGNFLMAFLVGILVTPLYQHFSSKIKSSWRAFLNTGFLAGVLFFLAFEINGILDHSKQDRIDQNAWQSLIEDVSMKAPYGSHVVLKFDEAGMVETAWSLEANTLFAKRYDLTYHLEIENKASVDEAGDFLKKNIELFNLERPAIYKNDKVLYVWADRRGGVNLRPYLNYQIFLSDKR